MKYLHLSIDKKMLTHLYKEIMSNCYAGYMLRRNLLPH